METQLEASINEILEQKQHLEDIVTPIFTKMATPRKFGIKSGLNVRNMVTEADLTLGQQIQHSDDVLQNCALETYTASLTSVTPISLIKS